MVYQKRVVSTISHKFFVEIAQLRKGLKKMSEQFSMNTLGKLDQFIDSHPDRTLSLVLERVRQACPAFLV